MALVLLCCLPIGYLTGHHPDWERESARWQKFAWISDHEVCWVANDGRRKPERPPLRLVVRDVRTGSERDLHPSFLARRSVPPGDMAYSPADRRLYVLDERLFGTTLIRLDLDTLAWTRSKLSRETGAWAHVVVSEGLGRPFLRSVLNGGGPAVSGTDPIRWEPLQPSAGEAPYVTGGATGSPDLAEDGLWEDRSGFVTYVRGRGLIRRDASGCRVEVAVAAPPAPDLAGVWLDARLVAPDVLVVLPQQEDYAIRWNCRTGEVERSAPLPRHRRPLSWYRLAPGGNAVIYWGDTYWSQWEQGIRTGPETRVLTWLRPDAPHR